MYFCHFVIEFGYFGLTWNQIVAMLSLLTKEMILLKTIVPLSYKNYSLLQTNYSYFEVNYSFFWKL